MSRIIAPCSLELYKSQRLAGVHREFLTSRNLRREHWQARNETAGFSRFVVSLPSATEQYNRGGIHEADGNFIAAVEHQATASIPIQAVN